MSENDLKDHLKIEELDDYMHGQLEPDELARVKRHLDDCPLCRLEIKRMARFEEIDSDDELAEEADWQSARFKMERAFKDRVLPVVVGKSSAERGARPSFFTLRWLAPLAAAAAVVILIFVYVERIYSPRVSHREFGPMRGELAPEYEIILESPVGNIQAYPDRFEWRSGVESDYYKIEIFTSDLEQVHVVESVKESKWVPPDSVKARFEHGTFYLWSVKGYKGLNREVTSPNAWFRIKSDE